MKLDYGSRKGYLNNLSKMTETSQMHKVGTNVSKFQLLFSYKLFEISHNRLSQAFFKAFAIGETFLIQRLN